MIDVLDSFPITILCDNHVVLWYECGIICSICALIYKISYNCVQNERFLKHFSISYRMVTKVPCGQRESVLNVYSKFKSQHMYISVLVACDKEFNV